jgi:hypothetical protein
MCGRDTWLIDQIAGLDGQVDLSDSSLCWPTLGITIRSGTP